MGRKSGPYLLHRVAAGQSGYRHHSHVKQSTEECGEEHDFGKNEPTHAPAEGQIYLLVIFASLALTNHCTEPADHHINNGCHAGDNDPWTPSDPVHPKYAAECHQEQRTCANDWPVRRLRQIVACGLA